MRRETLFHSAKRIKSDIESSGLLQMLEKGIESTRRREAMKDQAPSWVSFEVFQKYSLLVSSYGDADKQVLQILDLDDLSSPTFWAVLHESEPQRLFATRANIRFAIDYLPKLLQLIEQGHIEAFRNQDTNTPSELSGKSLLTVILVEDEGQFSSPSRLVYILDAISNIYSVIATLEGQADSDLSVLACDSGSDKSFDFLGLAKLMEEVRNIVLSIWDRRVFHRHMHVSQCMVLIAESLPIIERIHSLKQSGAIGPEQAELLKRKTIEGATKFLESGAVIAEMEHEAKQSPRLLMRPEPKLLAAPMEGDVLHMATEDAKDTELVDGADMTQEEIDELERLVSKAKGINKKHRPSRKKGTLGQ